MKARLLLQFLQKVISFRMVSTKLELADTIGFSLNLWDSYFETHNKIFFSYDYQLILLSVLHSFEETREASSSYQSRRWHRSCVPFLLSFAIFLGLITKEKDIFF